MRAATALAVERPLAAFYRMHASYTGGIRLRRTIRGIDLATDGAAGKLGQIAQTPSQFADTLVMPFGLVDFGVDSGCGVDDVCGDNVLLTQTHSGTALTGTLIHGDGTNVPLIETTSLHGSALVASGIIANSTDSPAAVTLSNNRFVDNDLTSNYSVVDSMGMWRSDGEMAGFSDSGQIAD
jgi:hypothetical protein